jgi:hypothetical protein
MIQFNTFSLHDLIGLMAITPLAAIFYVTYFMFGRRKLDLLFGNLMLCCVAICAVTFLVDNVVPAGVPSALIADGPERTLFLLRLLHTMAFLETAILLHFVCQYCDMDRIGRMPVGWVYVLAMGFVPMVWTSWFMSARLSPLAETSSLLYVLPYLPESGPLAGVLFVLFWGSGNLFAFCCLWRYHAQIRRRAGDAFTRTKLILLAVAFPLVTGALDAGTAGFDLHASVATIPVGLTIMGVIVAWALLQGRIRADREKQQLDHELALASEIQRGLLPLSPPDIEGFELGGWSESAEQTGGDTYDFMVLPDRQVMVTLADAAGHGMGPALMIAETRAVLRAFALSQRDPAIILRDAGQLLVMDLPEDRMVTCFVGVIDPPSSTLTYAAAGQGPVIFYRRRTDEFEQATATGPPLSAGVPAGIGAELGHFQFEKGDFVVLASDGFFEAPDAAGERLGIDRFVAALRAERMNPADRLISAARAVVRKFIEGADQEDDMTIVVIRKT